ncbi:hypothetical protein FA95DRAFT_1557599 [Auriscalpium vulgare]|uniref:Uncharacterized protein n=1 Tax=Auriscalpium vulgare TaxID=40419 RepID=A0ACB8RZ12_9AGAM|nr:hypothetical protein FA95DRAFT_1557599 [Auriscalpium vulgare]
MPGPTPHRTPLRRVSQGSLSALSRSGAHPDAPHGLGFLEPAMAELADEADALHANVDGLRVLGNALQTFNESFASWLYVMNMNALTVEWPEVRMRVALYPVYLDSWEGTNRRVFHPCKTTSRCAFRDCHCVRLPEPFRDRGGRTRCSPSASGANTA